MPHPSHFYSWQHGKEINGPGRNLYPPLPVLVIRRNHSISHRYWSKVKVGVLRPVQQPGSYWDRSSELPLVGLEPTEVTAYD